MKYALSFLAAVMTATAAPAESWNLQGVEYKVDTLQHFQAGPGTMLTVLDLEGPVRQRVWVSTTDLTCPDLDIATPIGDKVRTDRLTVPELVEEQKDDGNIYFLGVNSDLFSTLGPLGTTITGGDIIKIAKEATDWRGAGLDADRSLYFGNPGISFGASINGNRAFAPSLINVPRYKGESNCILYSHRWGKSTETNKIMDGGKWIDQTSEMIEIVLRPVDGKLHSDGPTDFTVVGSPVRGTEGNTAIPDGCFVLSTNASNQFGRFSAFKDGDIYTLTPSSISVTGQGFGVNHSFSSITELCGGAPLLLENGEPTGRYASMPNNDIRRPRTAIGTDASRRRMMLLVVDGDKFNNGISAGVDALDLVDMLRAIGCTDALNFDGGGSSTMYTSTFGVHNRPSDGHERKVCNAWFLTTPDKGDTTVDRIEFVNPRRTFAKGESFEPLVYGYNAAGLPVATDIKDAVFDIPAAMGTFDGTTATVTADGTFIVTAQWQGKTATMAVRAGDFNSSVNAIDVPAATVRYHKLDGTAVKNPSPGMYIETRGSESKKILIK